MFSCAWCFSDSLISRTQVGALRDVAPMRLLKGRRRLDGVKCKYRPPGLGTEKTTLAAVKQAAPELRKYVAQRYLRGALDLGDGTRRVKYAGTKELFMEPGRLTVADLDYLAALFPCARARAGLGLVLVFGCRVHFGLSDSMFARKHAHTRVPRRASRHGLQSRNEPHGPLDTRHNRPAS